MSTVELLVGASLLSVAAVFALSALVRGDRVFAAAAGLLGLVAGLLFVTPAAEQISAA